jgi:hypothetical protein
MPISAHHRGFHLTKQYMTVPSFVHRADPSVVLRLPTSIKRTSLFVDPSQAAGVPTTPISYAHLPPITMK